MIVIPGLDEAIAEERRDRALAFIGQTEIICGVPVKQMTPIHWEWFRATNNPFVIGGEVTPEIAVHSLWLLAEAFESTKEASDLFAVSHAYLLKDAVPFLLRKELDEYFDRMFLDAPYGKDGLPYYSCAAGLGHAMAQEPYRWDTDRTMKSSLPVIFQFLKARDKAAGEVVINRKSHAIRGAWLDSQNAALEALRKKEARRAKRQRTQKPTDNGS